MAKEWLNEICPALDARPVDLIADDKGCLAVDCVLSCIDHGMIY